MTRDDEVDDNAAADALFEMACPERRFSLLLLVACCNRCISPAVAAIIAGVVPVLQLSQPSSLWLPRFGFATTAKTARKPSYSFIIVAVGAADLFDDGANLSS